MTQEEINEENKLIAEFMGGEYIETPYKGWINTPANDYCHIAQLHQFRYHVSWDWLMPVAEKIEKTGCIVEMSLSLGGLCRIVWIGKKRECAIHFKNQENDLLKCTFQTTVDFIKWYNKNKK